MRRQTRSASPVLDKRSSHGKVSEREATATPIKIKQAGSAAQGGSSFKRSATNSAVVVAVAVAEGTKRTAAKIGSHAAVKSERGVKGTKRVNTATGNPGGSSRRAVKQELKPENIEDPPPARSGSGPDTAKRRRTRTHADLEPLKGQGKRSAAPAARRVKRVEKRVGVDMNEVKDDENSSNKRPNSNKRAGQHPNKRKGKGNGEAERDDSARKAKVPPRVAEKAALIVEVMDALYPDPPIPLNHTNSFTLLCAVLLSAQTTDGQVNEVTKELFRVAPDPQTLSKMSQTQVQYIIRSVGLAPTKAKHLIALSQQLLECFGGEVPGTFEGLQSLPGVGRKTAAVVMTQAFGMPAFPVDTHIHRLALRWGLTKNQTNASRFILVGVEEDLMAVFPRESWCKLHLQLIYFGREHCQARAHEAPTCPVCSWIKKTGPSAPRSVAELTCLRNFLATPTPPKKSSKNAIIYQERLLKMEQFKMKIET